MKEAVAAILWMGSFAVSNAQNLVNVIDHNQLKQGHWIYLNKDKKWPGYTAEQKVEEGDFVDNLKDGLWTQYFNNEKIKEQLTFHKNMPNGPAVFYYPNGNKKEEGTWKNGQWVGEYKYYFENGRLASEWQYNSAGARTGEQKYYHENGKLHIVGEWINGKENGTIKEYYENGELKSEKTYAKGSIDAQSVKVYEKKNLASNTSVNTKTENKETVVVEQTDKGKFEVGVFDGNGMYQLKDKEGRVAREGLFENGALKDGKVFQYDNDGKLIKTLLYRAGKVAQIIDHLELGQ